jgi:hypothetical protein
MKNQTKNAYAALNIPQKKVENNIEMMDNTFKEAYIED